MEYSKPKIEFNLEFALHRSNIELEFGVCSCKSLTETSANHEFLFIFVFSLFLNVSFQFTSSNRL